MDRKVDYKLALYNQKWRLTSWEGKGIKIINFESNYQKWRKWRKISKVKSSFKAN